jgi:hypothetical protein
VIAIFKEKNPGAVLLLFFLGLLLRLKFYVHPLPLDESLTYTGYLGFWLNKFVIFKSASYLTVNISIAYLLTFLQAVRLNMILSNQRMFAKTNHLPGFCYLVFTCYSFSWCVVSPSLIINSFLIFLFSQLMLLYNAQNPKINIYNAALLLGCAALLYHNNIIFIVWVIFAIVILRPPKISEWIIAILGISTPFYFLAIYLYLTNSLSQIQQFYLQFHFVKKLPVLGGFAFGGFILIFLISLLGVAFWQQNLRRMLIQSRKNWWLVVTGAIVSIVAFLFSFLHNQAALPMILFAACLAANFYFYNKNKLTNLLAGWLVVLFVLAGWFFH